MDDYSTQSLTESKNEWCSRLVNILNPLVISGFKSIFDESWKLCEENDEEDKYLMTFQNFLSRVPKWNPNIIEEERKRIIENSGCGYLEDLITCVHIIQLKALTCVRVGQKQKKIDVDVPSLDDFIHKVYIAVARKIYTNVYLFEKDIMPLQIQKHNRELEIIVRECIMDSIRESIPVEKVLRVYMDETEEQDVIVEEKEETIPMEEDETDDKDDSDKKSDKVETTKEDNDNTKEDSDNVKEDGDNQIESNDENVTMVVKTDKVDTIDLNDTKLDPKTQAEKNRTEEKSLIVTDNKPTGLSFNDNDQAIDIKGKEEMISAPKNVERLEEISNINHEKRKMEEEEEEEEEKIKIGSDIRLDDFDIQSINKPQLKTEPDPLLNDVEILT